MVTLELDLLYEIRRASFPCRNVQAELQVEIGLGVCELPFSRIIYAAREEIWTRDPFDRIIVAQVKANGFADLISADKQIKEQ
jgi:PIN domain nuclease of toxin-antitoxin system